MITNHVIRTGLTTFPAKLTLKQVRYNCCIFLVVRQSFVLHTNISTPRRLFCNKYENKYLFRFYHGNKIKLIYFLYRNRSISEVIPIQNCKKKEAVPCCILVILGKQRIGFLQKFKYVLFF